MFYLFPHNLLYHKINTSRLTYGGPRSASAWALWPQPHTQQSRVAQYILTHVGHSLQEIFHTLTPVQHN